MEALQWHFLYSSIVKGESLVLQRKRNWQWKVQHPLCSLGLLAAQLWSLSWSLSDLLGGAINSWCSAHHVLSQGLSIMCPFTGWAPLVVSVTDQTPREEKQQRNSAKYGEKHCKADSIKGAKTNVRRWHHYRKNLSGKGGTWKSSNSHG